MWIAATGVVSFIALAYFFAGSLIAPANRPVVIPKGLATEIPIESVNIENESGSKLAAWVIDHADANATVILLHPLRSNRGSMLGRAKLFYEAGYSVLMIDFTSHGESPGNAITMGYRESADVTAAVKFVQNRSPENKIGVVGRSLGGASALLAMPKPIDMLVLESVYPTLLEAVENRIEMRLGKLKHILTPALLCQLKPRLGFSPQDLRPIDHLQQVPCPVMIMAGDQDQHTPIKETQALFHQTNDPKTLVIFQGAEHEDLLRFNPEQYRTAVVEFASKYLQ